MFLGFPLRYYPQAGWTEHDAEEILQGAIECTEGEKFESGDPGPETVEGIYNRPWMVLSFRNPRKTGLLLWPS